MKVVNYSLDVSPVAGNVCVCVRIPSYIFCGVTFLGWRGGCCVAGLRWLVIIITVWLGHGRRRGSGPVISVVTWPFHLSLVHCQPASPSCLLPLRNCFTLTLCSVFPPYLKVFSLFHRIPPFCTMPHCAVYLSCSLPHPCLTLP